MSDSTKENSGMSGSTKLIIGIAAVAAVCIFILVLLGLGYWSAYSALNKGKQEVAEKAANVDSALQRRHDLIPDLVEAVKGYAKHEEKVLREVTEARAKVGQVNLAGATGDPKKMGEFQKAQSELSASLGRLLVVFEKYPDLKASEGFLKFQDQKEGTENRIKVARDNYNEAVKNQNTRVNGLFSGFVARMNGFKEEPFYQADSEAHTNPKVKF
jgi:LemA protein